MIRLNVQSNTSPPMEYGQSPPHAMLDQSSNQYMNEATTQHYPHTGQLSICLFAYLSAYLTMYLSTY